MADEFPIKKKGDGLSHEHVNALSEVARMTRNHLGGSPHTLWRQHIFKVTEDDSAEGATEGIYKGKMRYFSHGGEEWKEKDREWDLDTNGLEIAVSVDDFIMAYWDEQRGMFVPIQVTSPIVAFTLTEDMGNTTSGEASVTVHGTWDAATEAYTGSDPGVVISPGGAFDDALDEAYGEGRFRPGNDRTVIDPNWITC